ncbi:hypothetical protein J6590_058128 [Homalodisca vitripennis]|nr:hypothetical protein J6590_058128 [Homalodisca vitripennis]
MDCSMIILEKSGSIPVSRTPRHTCTGRGSAEYFPEPTKAGSVNVFSTPVNRDK